MLQSPYYHKLIRKYVSAFGSLFNEMVLVRMNKDRTTELERFVVPIRYGPQENWLGRIRGDANLDAKTQIVLPVMSFEIRDYAFDSSRNRNALIRNVAANTATNNATQYSGVPYTIDFELNIYAKSTDDANQIVEQIIPTFTPDYNVSIVPIDEMGTVIDIPVTLNSISNNTEYENNFEELRVIQWTLSFTMKAWFWGPVSTAGIIKTVHANTYLDPTIQAGAIVRANLGTGNGIYHLEEYAYQGNTFATATAAGVIVAYDANNSYVRIAGAQGTFQTGEEIKGVDSNGVYVLSSFDASPLKLVTIKTEPDPNTANAWDDYGYTFTITEYPETTT